jgi:hypothetical protein
MRRALFRLHILIATGGAGRRNNLEPAASWRGYQHFRIYSSRRADHSLGSRQFVAQGFSSTSSNCRRLALDVRRTCGAVLRHCRPWVFQLSQRRAGNGDARENSNEQQDTHRHIPLQRGTRTLRETSEHANRSVYLGSDLHRRFPARFRASAGGLGTRPRSTRSAAAPARRPAIPCKRDPEIKFAHGLQ